MQFRLVFIGDSSSKTDWRCCCCCCCCCWWCCCCFNGMPFHVKRNLVKAYISSFSYCFHSVNVITFGLIKGLLLCYFKFSEMTWFIAEPSKRSKKNQSSKSLKLYWHARLKRFLSLFFWQKKKFFYQFIFERGKSNKYTFYERQI